MERLLIVGVGDVARRALPALVARFDSLALLRPGAAAVPGARVASGDLDRPETLAPLAGAAELVLHLAPPDETRDGDVRTRNLIAALSGARMLPRRFVYISTSGVYGDCGGARVDESRPVNPQTPRAARRVDAERMVTEWGAASGVETVILRVPGIYASDRLPVERLKRGTPVLRADEDVYTNHVHAEDLAAICVRALEADAPAGIYNASDDSELKMGEWFDLVADRCGLPRPPRVSRAEATRVISPMLLSFMSESRRLVNRRLKDVLGVRLKHPTVFDGVPHGTATVARAGACG
jgi:nucleoside-diphosphate-sugar epimerase